MNTGTSRVPLGGFVELQVGSGRSFVGTMLLMCVVSTGRAGRAEILDSQGVRRGRSLTTSTYMYVVLSASTHWNALTSRYDSFP